MLDLKPPPARQNTNKLDRDNKKGGNRSHLLWWSVIPRKIEQGRRNERPRLKILFRWWSKNVEKLIFNNKIRKNYWRKNITISPDKKARKYRSKSLFFGNVVDKSWRKKMRCCCLFPGPLAKTDGTPKPKKATVICSTQIDPGSQTWYQKKRKPFWINEIKSRNSLWWGLTFDPRSQTNWQLIPKIPWNDLKVLQNECHFKKNQNKFLAFWPSSL